MRGTLPRLHAPTDDRILARPDFFVRAAALIAAGVAVHLRSASRGGRALLGLADRLPGAWINDRVDVARVARAPGVHLPAAGLPTPAARGVLGPGVFIGRSTHSIGEARAALADGADYVMLGPIWSTPTHAQRPALGPGALTAATTDAARVVAIGGVTADRAGACRAAGAYGAAAVSALWDADDPAATAAAMLLLLEP